MRDVVTSPLARYKQNPPLRTLADGGKFRWMRYDFPALLL